MRVLFASALTLATLSTAAFASQCPSLIKQAQEQLKAMESMGSMHGTMMKEAASYIEKAQAEHDAGEHDASVADAKKALELLQM